jgi:hypothetical protein
MQDIPQVTGSDKYNFIAASKRMGVAETDVRMFTDMNN